MLSFCQVERMGADLRRDEKEFLFVRRPPEDLYSLMYTSGSTGVREEGGPLFFFSSLESIAAFSWMHMQKPKGVMITYAVWNAILTKGSFSLDPLGSFFSSCRGLKPNPI